MHTARKNQHPQGEVRIRSNICADPTAWRLVPGDLAAHYMASADLTPQQRKERMYYERCCLCHRNSFQIEEEGCDYCFKNGHGTLSEAQARQRRKTRFNAEAEQL